ncbi:MAG: CpsD/CapB family tyrosine-protein kinase [Acidobacteria bacterium]|nr:CpsD/CapB family tyrosine-protein kinase [Acidobacteriota bacterium]
MATPPIDGTAREEVTKLVQRVFLLPKNGTAPGAVIFCGIELGQGSSWISSRAAVILAKQGTGTVCLVDANLRSPSLHQHFSADNWHGWADALRKERSLRDLAQPVLGGNLWLVPSGSVTPDLYARLGSERLRKCLAELRTQFTHVLIDAPPASPHGDAALLGKLADGVVLVVEANSTRRETTRQVKESFESAKVRLLGTVLNQRTFPIPESLYRKL